MGLFFRDPGCAARLTYGTACPCLISTLQGRPRGFPSRRS